MAIKTIEQRVGELELQNKRASVEILRLRGRLDGMDEMYSGDKKKGKKGKPAKTVETPEAPVVDAPESL